MKKLKALDLFCGGGGSCIGMIQAGFDEVVGIDIETHPNYPGDFIQGDVMNLPVSDILDFDFIWASPPCQAYSHVLHCHKDFVSDKPKLVEYVRELISEHPYTCMENVPGSPTRPDLILNGPSVGLEWINRKRIFELSFWVWELHKPRPKGIAFSICTGLGAMNPTQLRTVKELGLPNTLPIEVAMTFMGIPLEYKFTKREIGESVAPPMAKYIAETAIKLIQK